MDDTEIDSIHTYDFRRARLSLALKWILSAAFGPSIPKELQEPLPLKDKDTVAAIYVNTGLVSLLVNGRIYNQACANLFPQRTKLWKLDGGHWSVIGGLGQLGVYVMDDNGAPIKERELVQTDSFHLTAHVCLIEAIMTAYSQDKATTEKIVPAVKAVGPFNASEDLPIDYEDALLVWMNKVTVACQKMANTTRQSSHTGDHSPASVRLTRSQLAETNPSATIPLMEDILKDISDGCNLCALISFYCPAHLRYPDIQTGNHVGIGDSIHNLTLVKAFCDRYLPVRIYHFSYEDILYSTHTVKPSLLAFLTHLFKYFVLDPLDIVRQIPAQKSLNNNQGFRAYSAPPSKASQNQNSGSVPLISNATKQSFHLPHSQSTPPQRLSRTADHYGSNPSLNSSSASAAGAGSLSSRLLHKRSSQADAAHSKDSNSMHDTLSPIMVRKSQSMGILSSPDPKQSMVAWEGKSYFVDRNKNNEPNRASNGNQSLLSNVSFDEGPEDDERVSSPDHSAELSSINSAKDLQRRHNSSYLSARSNNVHSDSHRQAKAGASDMSNSYQKLLDRSNDLESPLKLFAQKHGFQLAQGDKDTAEAANHVTQKSPSPVDISVTELTKVTPRSDSEGSPRQYADNDRNGEMSITGQSYVISTALNPATAQAAGLPVIQNSGVSDSMTTDITFASFADGIPQDNGRDSPIEPIVITNGEDNSTQITDTRLSVTSFADISKLRSPTAVLQDSVDMSAASPSSGLKQRFELQKNGPDGKAAKKTTFSLNQTTWTDQPSRPRTNSGDTESDSHSESSEASNDRKQFSDVKILLEEKRKIMEKKKRLEEIERTKEMNAASRQAFLKAVSKNKSDRNHDNTSSDPSKAFSRDDISKSIENLQSKWQRDERDNAKRAAATTAAKTINVTPASLDNITEVSESSEVDTPKVPLPAATASSTSMSDLASRQDRKSPEHEAPLELEQFGLDKLNASLSELRGEMKRLSDEQKRIEELQTVMKSVQPQSRSTPRSKAAANNQPRKLVQNDNQSSFNNPSQHSEPENRQPDPTLRLSELDHNSSTSGDVNTTQDRASISQSYHGQMDNDFSQPSIHSMSQSTDEPFMLHNTPTKKHSVSDSKKNRQSQAEPMAVSSPKTTPKSGSTMKRANSNGFLSSSQLSRKKASVSSTPEAPPVQDTPPAATVVLPPSAEESGQLLDQSAGRKRWGANSGPLFPGYDDDRSTRSKVREPEMVTQDQQPVFQPPPEQSTPPISHRQRKSTNKSFQQQSPLDTPLRDTQFEVRQLPGRQIPSDLSLEDTPMREASGGLPQGQHYHGRIQTNSMDDTPMRDAYMQRMSNNMLDESDHQSCGNMSGVSPHPYSLSIDTPLRMYPNQGTYDTIDTPMRQQYSGPYNDQLDTPLRQHQPLDDTPVRLAAARSRQRPQSMIETVSNHNLSMDTPMRDALRSNNEIFYSPPTRHKSVTAEHDSSPHVQQSPMAHSFTDTPMRQAQAVSRHGTAAIPPQATSRHGAVSTEQPLDMSENKTRYVTAPYEFQSQEPEKASSSQPYKLTTPYGTAQNELVPTQTNISLSSAMDAIRTDVMKQHMKPESAANNMPFGLTSQAQTVPEYHPIPTNIHRVTSGGSSDIDAAMTDVLYNQSASAVSPAASSAASAVTSVSAQAEGSLLRQASLDNEDRASIHSGSGDSDGTPRGGGRPKRATWDMSTPRGDLLNQPGVGFIVAEQSQPSEEELQKRKEKVLMMQMKRREEQELKKQQKAAELAAKAENARIKEVESEKRKLEEKMKKEAILQQHQYRKAEEEIPPEMRAQFRQKQNKRGRGGDRPASIHWAGTSHDEGSLRASDALDSASSFTVSLGPASGNLTHRRPSSPASSTATGSISSRSKAPSRGAIEAPPVEYSGPKLYVQPSQKQKSNRHIIINAVSHCCLAGVVNTENKNKVLEEIAKSDGKHFLILFRDGNQTYKAVYSFCPDSEECTKVHGQGPKYIKDEMCHRFYKYNSGGKKFTEVSTTKHLSVSIDAITIHNHLWQKKPGPGSRR